MDLKTALRNLRVKHTLYQRELAELINVEPQAISNYERGREPTVSMMKLLTKALNFTFIIRKGELEIKEETNMSNTKKLYKDCYGTKEIDFQGDFVLIKDEKKSVSMKELLEKKMIERPFVKISFNDNLPSIILKKEDFDGWEVYSLTLEEFILYIHKEKLENMNKYSLSHTRDEVFIDEDEWGKTKFERVSDEYKKIFTENNGQVFTHYFNYTEGTMEDKLPDNYEELDIKEVNDSYYTAISDAVAAGIEILSSYYANEKSKINAS